jgi:hypothetical protein
MPVYKDKSRSRKIDRPKSPDNKTVIGEEALGIPDNIKVICNYCNFDTNIRIDKETFYCNRCQVLIIITQEDIRNYYDLQVPQGPTNETLVSSIPSPSYQTIKKEPKLQGGFKALADKGLKIKNYNE